MYLCTEYKLVWNLILWFITNLSNFNCRQLQPRASSSCLDMDLLQKLQEPLLPNMIVFRCNSERNPHVINYKLQGKLWCCIKLQHRAHEFRVFFFTYLLKCIIWLVGMATSLAKTSASPLWNSETSKCYLRNVLPRRTPQMGFWSTDFSRGKHSRILHCWLPFKNVSANSCGCSFDQSNSRGIITPFFEDNQMVSTWLQPRTRNMVPTSKKTLLWIFWIRSTNDNCNRIVSHHLWEGCPQLVLHFLSL